MLIRLGHNPKLRLSSGTVCILIYIMRREKGVSIFDTAIILFECLCIKCSVTTWHLPIVRLV